MSTTNDGQRAKVDQPDGGPGSHPADGGGEENDVASGGVSERAHDEDSSRDADSERDVNPDRDVHGDPETPA
ncbi:hypothetical protein [Flexivirga caeni]|uniref:Uncharacterized protein n=1 Tax=Flexivirga caeni TaxID=2294115 RepID=A0A3M9LXD3_9MICO|nr:hypothetical protein [Flexivirga caeni]RNI17961.1 hypothetical protein EFY87_18830 [Flexivirga caeni]